MYYKMIYGASTTSIAKEAIYELSQKKTFKSLHVFPTEDIDIALLIATMSKEFPDIVITTCTVDGVGDYVKQYAQTGVIFLAFDNVPVIHKLKVSNLESESNKIVLSEFCFVHSSLKKKNISRLVKCLSDNYAETNFYGANHSLLYHGQSEEEILLIDYKEKITCKPFITNFDDFEMSKEFTVKKIENGDITEFDEESAFSSICSYFKRYTASEVGLIIHDELKEARLTSMNALSTNSCVNVGDKIQIIAKNGVTLKEEFLKLAKEVANEYDQNFIVTCLTRVNAMIETNHLVDLEEKKTKFFEGSGKEGFGFGSNGVFYGRGTNFKFQSHLVQMLGMKEQN